MKKIQVEETQERSLGDIVGDIQEVIDYLEEKKKEGWETIDYDWADLQLVFTRYRLETDKELAKRKKELEKRKIENEKQKARIEQQARLIYEKLKKKFENEKEN